VLYVVDPHAAEGPRVTMAVSPIVERGGGTVVLVMPMPAGAELVEVDSEVFDALHSDSRRTVKESVTFIEDVALGYQCSDPHYSAVGALPRMSPVAALAVSTLACATPEIGGTRAALVDGEVSDAGADVAPNHDADAAPRDGGYDADAGPDSGGGDAAAPCAVRDGANHPTTRAYTVSTFEGIGALDALRDLLGSLDLALDPAREEILDRYVAAGNGLLAIELHPDAPCGHALSPIAIRFVAAHPPIWNELQHDLAGGTLYTDAFVIAPERREPAAGLADTIFAAPYVASPELAAITPDNVWLTRMTLTRVVHVEELDDVFAPSASTSEVYAEVTTERTVRIPVPCCPGAGIPPGGGRTSIQVLEYPEGEEPTDEELAALAPPLSPAECDPGYSPSPMGSGDAGWSADDPGASCGGSSSSTPSEPLCSYEPSGCLGGSGCGCSTTLSPLGGTEPIVLALAWLFLNARRRR
jgi:hypothetical protein